MFYTDEVGCKVTWGSGYTAPVDVVALQFGESLGHDDAIGRGEEGVVVEDFFGAVAGEG